MKERGRDALLPKRGSSSRAAGRGRREKATEERSRREGTNALGALTPTKKGMQETPRFPKLLIRTALSPERAREEGKGPFSY